MLTTDLTTPRASLIRHIRIYEVRQGRMVGNAANYVDAALIGHVAVDETGAQSYCDPFKAVAAKWPDLELVSVSQVGAVYVMPEGLAYYTCCPYTNRPIEEAIALIA